jgi:phosphoglycolate phosphatase-like HAD superfamily hydrolase
MIVFDVDGTLIGGEVLDWGSFEGAFEEIAGFSLDAAFFERIEEVTCQAIIHQALSHLSIEERKQQELAVCGSYLRRLREGCAIDPGAFPAAHGAVRLLRELKARGVKVAIATGDWRATISFKLEAAGIHYSDIPMVTASEYYSRADIIAGAVAKAGGSLAETTVVGDALWDLRACAKLGVRFVGVGRRGGDLRKAGARHVLEDLNPEEFWRARDGWSAVDGSSDAASSKLTGRPPIG